MSDRPIESADITAVYQKFATTAVDTYNEFHGCPPVLAAVQMRDAPGEVERVIFMPSNVVRMFHETPESKDALMALVRLLLSRREAAGWEHLLELEVPFVPDAVVHVTEAWILRKPAPPKLATSDGEHLDGYDSVREHPDKGEALMVTVHTGHGTYAGICPIDDAVPKHATFEPLIDPRGQLTGRLSLNEASDGPVH